MSAGDGKHDFGTANKLDPLPSPPDVQIPGSVYVLIQIMRYC